MTYYTEDNSMGGILFSADFEKHSIQLNTRSYLLLSNRTSIHILYDEQRPLHRVLSLESGTRQGDRLSAYLFILCLETIFIQIRENDNIKVMGMSDYQVKLRQC